MKMQFNVKKFITIVPQGEGLKGRVKKWLMASKGRYLAEIDMRLLFLISA